VFKGTRNGYGDAIRHMRHETTIPEASLAGARHDICHMIPAYPLADNTARVLKRAQALPYVAAGVAAAARPKKHW
jgi:hypothetical protein